MANEILNELNLESFREEFIKYTVKAFKMLPKQDKPRILDIGCGSGRETAELWMKFKGNSYIVGVDPIPSFIETARELFRIILEETIQKIAKNTSPGRS